MVVYPRWRGELFCALAFCWLSRGLSPLARGTLCRCQHCWRVIRFIPAGAGNTVPRIISLSSSTVYPRWRGEHSASLMPIIGLGGLSPLARGTRRQRIVRLPLHRFIPANGICVILHNLNNIHPGFTIQFDMCINHLLNGVIWSVMKPKACRNAVRLPAFHH